MTQPQTVKQDNITLGAGYAYFDERDANGNFLGRDYIGDTTGITINAETENLEVENADTPVAEVFFDITTKITRSGTVNARNVNDGNWSRFIMGSAVARSETATPVVDEPFTVKQGRYYQLGASAANPGGVRNVSAVTVTDTVPTPFTLTTDYLVNADDGTIYIVPGGGIADDTAILVDYTPAVQSRTEVQSNSNGPQIGEFFFQGDNTQGENRSLLIPLCEIAAAGEVNMKSRDTVVEFPFALRIQTRTGYPQVIVLGVTT